LVESGKFHIGWRVVLSLVFLAVLAPWPSAWARPAITADTVIVNARIYTVNARQPWAEALAIGGDKILAVGSAKEIAAYRGPSTKVIDAQGKLILPGFVDCHIHFMEGSLGLTQVDLNGSKSVAEIQKRVKTYADAHPEEKWILGMGWTYPTFGPSALPDKKFLDQVVPDRPGISCAPSMATAPGPTARHLEMAGITRDTPDPPNGRIMRDAKGDATGALQESADDLIARFTPTPDP
jgi:predicted amidohydrolase YtcJ